MCSEFKVILALLFLSCVLRRFFSLDKDLGKKKKAAWHLLNSCYDAVHNFFGYHRKMNKNQSNNCFHEWHPHSLRGQGLNVWESLCGPSVLSLLFLPCENTPMHHQGLQMISIISLFSSVSLLYIPWSQSGKLKVRQNLYTDESTSSNVYICMCPSHAQIPYGNPGASV